MPRRGIGVIAASPVDVRRCLFIPNDPEGDVIIPGRVQLGNPRAAGKLGGSVLVVDARGRVEEDAILGKPVFPLRALPFGAPDARFLSKGQRSAANVCRSTHRFLITSVFSDKGRTTPCNFCKSDEHHR